MRKLILTICIIAFLSGCNTSSSTTKNQKKSDQNLAAANMPLQQIFVKVQEEQSKRIVSIDESMTQILYALGEGNNIVALDKPLAKVPSSSKIPRIGYKRALNLNDLLAYEPTMVISSIDGSPENIVEAAKARDIDYFTFAQPLTIEELKENILQIGTSVNKESQAEKITTTLEADMRNLQGQLKGIKDTLRIVYLYAKSEETLMLAGPNSVADAIIKLAGAKNAIVDIEKEGLRRLTAEDLMNAKADYILMSSQDFKTMMGKWAKIPGLLYTKAGRMGKIITLDESELSYLSTHSTKTAHKLASKIYPQLFKRNA